MSNNNWWGPPDEDEEPLPEWMRAETYRNGGQPKPRGASLDDAIKKAMNQPPVDLSYLQKDKKDE